LPGNAVISPRHQWGLYWRFRPLDLAWRLAMIVDFLHSSIILPVAS